MEHKTRDYGSENKRNLKLVIALARTNSIGYRSTQKLLSKHKLTISQFGVLEALYHLNDMCINDLIEKTLSTSGNMTVIIKNLERDGYIQKIPCKVDGRRTDIHLKPKGAKLINQIFPEHLQEIEQNFTRLSNPEKEQLISLLKKLNGYESK
ncbi:MAG: MarR family transcriptional regulator [Candidatus Zophobacter franzmannii]|jgi:DNA-binding MarR family transcriptional regulator|nr:MarR family transcriptional regulator [Candidatus Zophobacter franzmannii]